MFRSSCLPRQLEAEWHFGGVKYRYGGNKEGKLRRLVSFTISLISRIWVFPCQIFHQLIDDDWDMKDTCPLVEVDFWEIQIKIWSCKSSWPVPCPLTVSSYYKLYPYRKCWELLVQIREVILRLLAKCKILSVLGYKHFGLLVNLTCGTICWESLIIISL